MASGDGDDEEGEDATREEGRWEMQGSELEEEEAAGGRVAPRGARSELEEEEAGREEWQPGELSSISIAPSNVTTRRCVFCSDFGPGTKRAEDEGR